MIQLILAKHPSISKTESTTFLDIIYKVWCGYDCFFLFNIYWPFNTALKTIQKAKQFLKMDY